MLTIYVGTDPINFSSVFYSMPLRMGIKVENSVFFFPSFYIIITYQNILPTIKTLIIAVPCKIGSWPLSLLFSNLSFWKLWLLIFKSSTFTNSRFTNSTFQNSTLLTLPFHSNLICTSFPSSFRRRKYFISKKEKKIRKQIDSKIVLLKIKPNLS